MKLAIGLMIFGVSLQIIGVIFIMLEMIYKFKMNRNIKLEIMKK